MKKVSEFFRLIDTLPPLVFSLMVLSVVAMNLLANKSIDTGLTWLALDCGILFSWLCFLAMDIMTHCYGPKAATAGSTTSYFLQRPEAFLCISITSRLCLRSGIMLNPTFV